MKRLAGLLLLVTVLSGCAAAPESAEPSEAEKAWHNCMTVLEASPTPRTDEAITAETICENQRATWENFNEKWIAEIGRLLAFYDVDRSAVTVYSS